MKISNIKFIIALSLVILNPTYIYGSEIYKNKFNSCTPSKKTLDNYEPKEFRRSNNLLRDSEYYGVEYRFKDKIIIFGKVLDKNCVPLANAKIYMWQVGADGKYYYHPLKDIADKKLFNFTNCKYSFKGNGSTSTDSNGNFVFITQKPKKSSKYPTSWGFNYRVKHNDGEMQTRIDIKQMQETLKDIQPEYKKEICKGLKLYKVKLVTDFAAKHKSY